MANAADTSKTDSTKSMDAALASQQALLEKNLEMNTAMAWLQAAQDLAKKIKG